MTGKKASKKVAKKSSKKPVEKKSRRKSTVKNAARERVLARIAACKDDLKDAREHHDAVSYLAAKSRKEARLGNLAENKAVELVYKRRKQLEKAKEALLKFDTRAEIFRLYKENKKVVKEREKEGTLARYISAMETEKEEAAEKPEPVQVAIIEEDDDDDMGVDEETDEGPTADDDMGADEETP